MAFSTIALILLHIFLRSSANAFPSIYLDINIYIPLILLLCSVFFVIKINDCPVMVQHAVNDKSLSRRLAIIATVADGTAVLLGATIN